MRDYGYLRIMACSPRVRVADVRFNCETITEAIEAADAARAALVVFPELSLTGYTCGDLFGQNLLIDKAEEAAKEIVRVSRAKAVTIVVGVPGGAIMAALGVLSSILGFNQEQQALMIALYITMDNFGTACNVTGDGAIALVIDKFFRKRT